MFHLAQPNDQAWGRVRRQAVLHALRNRLQRRRDLLVPLHDVRVRLPIRSSWYQGLRQVPLANIVGSENRTGDFDRSFLPQHEHLRDRWLRVDHAQRTTGALPPVVLYQIGEVFFVHDGHHRISVARAHGRVDIDALVTEYMVDVPLHAPLQARDLLLKEEYNDFLEWTQLHRLRPNQRIELSVLGGYLALVAEINRYRAQVAQARGADVTPDAAVTGWYDEVYLPRIAQLRQESVRMRDGRTDGDRYVAFIRRHHAHPQPGQAAINGKHTAMKIAHLHPSAVWARIGALVRGRTRPAASR